MRYTLSLTCFYVAAYAFITGSPDVYIRYFGVAPQHYGWLFAVNIVGVMLMSVAIAVWFSAMRWALLKAALAVSAIAVRVLAAGVRLHRRPGADCGEYFPVFSMNGVIAATSTAAALDEAGEYAGSASALIGSLQYGSGILFAAAGMAARRYALDDGVDYGRFYARQPVHGMDSLLWRRRQ
jgi:DHA1 family bicyclomycin/chloramphenicol resistance-like MFS transporter